MPEHLHSKMTASPLVSSINSASGYRGVSGLRAGRSIGARLSTYEPLLRQMLLHPAPVTLRRGKASPRRRDAADRGSPPPTTQVRPRQETRHPRARAIRSGHFSGHRWKKVMRHAGVQNRASSSIWQPSRSPSRRSARSSSVCMAPRLTKNYSALPNGSRAPACAVQDSVLPRGDGGAPPTARHSAEEQEKPARFVY